MKGFILAACCFFIRMQADAQFTHIKKKAEAELLHAAHMKQAHIGICIYEPATNKYWYQYQDDKFFTPASNMKIFALYAGMKLFGDMLPGIRYIITDTALFVKGMGDPSFLHPGYAYQPSFQLLKETSKKIYLVAAANQNKRYGAGWAWSDYADSYQPELNEWPMYGNVARIRHQKNTHEIVPQIYPLQVAVDDTISKSITERDERNNIFFLKYNPKDTLTFTAEVPFITGSVQDLRTRLQDTLHKPVGYTVAPLPTEAFKILYSIPSDSLFVPMMHRSDNFFAEQILMMGAACLWDTINSARLIDHLLGNELRYLPHPPQWADGSGLSRYNLVTPRDLVAVLSMLWQQFPQKRLWAIFPAGGEGTLKNYLQQQQVHAKTGSLNGVVALSGYLLTKKNKTLLFSILVNNCLDSTIHVKKAIERLLTLVGNEY